MKKPKRGGKSNNNNNDGDETDEKEGEEEGEKGGKSSKGPLTNSSNNNSLRRSGSSFKHEQAIAAAKNRLAEQVFLAHLVEKEGTKLGNLIFYMKKLWKDDPDARLIMFSQVSGREEREGMKRDRGEGKRRRDVWRFAVQ